MQRNKEIGRIGVGARTGYLASRPSIKNLNSGWIKEKLQEPHSYTIESEDDVNNRRNRNFIKPRQVPYATENYYSTNLGNLFLKPMPLALLPHYQHLLYHQKCILQQSNLILYWVQLELQLEQAQAVPDGQPEGIPFQRLTKEN